MTRFQQYNPEPPAPSVGLGLAPVLTGKHGAAPALSQGRSSPREPLPRRLRKEGLDCRFGALAASWVLSHSIVGQGGGSGPVENGSRHGGEQRRKLRGKRQNPRLCASDPYLGDHRQGTSPLRVLISSSAAVRNGPGQVFPNFPCPQE